MELSPAAGKILGMLMAYLVSSLGLLLAYYNYRKRIIKAEEIFTPLAKRIIGAVLGLVLIVTILIAASVGREGQGAIETLRENLVGILVPVVIFGFSFWMTWLLYRHFAQK